MPELQPKHKYTREDFLRTKKPTKKRKAGRPARIRIDIDPSIPPDLS